MAIVALLMFLLLQGILIGTAFGGTNWVVETLDSEGSVGSHVSLALDSNARERNVKAIFVQVNAHFLTIQGPRGSGTTNPGTGTYPFNSGDVQQITATPSPGWLFDHWLVDGVQTSTALTMIITMGADHRVQAVFVQSRNVSITVQGQGRTMPGGDTLARRVGTSLRFTQSPSEYWTFSHWVVDDLSLYNSSVTIVFDMDHSLEAVFKQKTPNCTLKLRTLNSSGKPIQGVVVVSTAQPVVQSRVELMTNQDGEANASPVYYGRYTLTFTKDGYDQVARNITLSPNTLFEANVTIYRSPVGLRLVIQNQDGVPMANVSVTSVTRPAGQTSVSGVTDDQGGIAFNVRPGNYTFNLRGAWVRRTLEPIIVNAGEASQVYLSKVWTVGALRISVMDEKSNLLDKVRVESISAPYGQETINKVFDGELILSDLLPGSYKVRLLREGYDSSEQLVNVEEGVENTIGPVRLAKSLITNLVENLPIVLAISTFIVGSVLYLVYDRWGKSLISRYVAIS